MKKIIAIILWFLLVSLDSNSPQKISVSSEVEKKVHNDVVAIQLSNKVKINRKHPYSKFCDNYHEIAMYYHLEHGIPTSVQLAQAIAESGGGYSPIAKYANNLFGMKYYKELYDGDYYVSLGGTKWRKYDSFSESFEDHALFLKKYYKHAVGKNWKYWTNHCKGYGFGEYWKHIGMVIEKYELWRYDELIIKHQINQSYDLLCDSSLNLSK
jgi:flagellum-specific peptidoglycan hydrolase FlgJ